jgi:hypothetical protein
LASTGNADHARHGKSSEIYALSEDQRLELEYALAKQLDTAYALQSSYGDLKLDPQMRDAVAAALRPIIKSRLKSP